MRLDPDGLTTQLMRAIAKAGGIDLPVNAKHSMRTHIRWRFCILTAFLLILAIAAGLFLYRLFF